MAKYLALFSANVDTPGQETCSNARKSAEKQNIVPKGGGFQNQVSGFAHIAAGCQCARPHVLFSTNVYLETTRVK